MKKGISGICFLKQLQLQIHNFRSVIGMLIFHDLGGYIMQSPFAILEDHDLYIYALRYKDFSMDDSNIAAVA